MRKYSLFNFLFIFYIIIILVGCTNFYMRDFNKAHPVIKAKGTFIHEQSGMKFPTEVGQFYRMIMNRYNDSGSNMSTRYYSKDKLKQIMISVFIYPISEKNENYNEILQNEMNIVKVNALYGSTNPDIIFDDDFLFNINSIESFGKRFKFGHERVYASKVQSVFEDNYLLIHGKFFIKYFITYPQKQKMEAGKLIEDFINSLSLPSISETSLHKITD